MTTVVDASVVVAALIDDGFDGTWAETVIVAGDLAAPHLMPVEVANILRRAVLAGSVSPDSAALALDDLRDLRVALFAFEPFLDRTWELRQNVTAYDAWYVALAEMLACPLATLDARLVDAPGPRCRFVTR